MQLLAVTIVPLVILVVIITLGSLALHQNAMRNMVGERDGLAVRTAAAAVDNQLKARLESISGLAMQIAHTPADQLSDRFSASAILLGEFDYGSAVFSTRFS